MSPRDARTTTVPDTSAVLLPAVTPRQRLARSRGLNAHERRQWRRFGPVSVAVRRLLESARHTLSRTISISHESGKNHQCETTLVEQAKGCCKALLCWDLHILQLGLLYLAHRCRDGGANLRKQLERIVRRAAIRKETLCRIEKAKVTADTATITKIVRVLEAAERGSAG
jgi:hypothetical protein